MHTMLSVIELPPTTDRLYAECKAISARLIDLTFSECPPQPVPSGTDLVQAFPDTYVYIVKGIYKSLVGKKIIRFFSAGDLVSIPSSEGNTRKIVTEFGSRIIVISSEEFRSRIFRNSDALCLYTTLRDLEAEVLAGICAAAIPENSRPEIECREYQEGEVIISEGEVAEDVYQMVEGSATVSRAGVLVGHIGLGEVFGELSFLADKPRTATVTAQSRCIAQRMTRTDFVEQLTKCRPQMMVEIARTLARRLIESNTMMIGMMT